jgi:hypothetical protein
MVTDHKRCLVSTQRVRLPNRHSSRWVQPGSVCATVLTYQCVSLLCTPTAVLTAPTGAAVEPFGPPDDRHCDWWLQPCSEPWACKP